MKFFTYIYLLSLLTLVAFMKFYFVLFSNSFEPVMTYLYLDSAFLTHSYHPPKLELTIFVQFGFLCSYPQNFCRCIASPYLPEIKNGRLTQYYH